MNTDERAIRDLVALWHSATAKGDVDTVLSLMAEDVVFLVAGKPPMRGRSSFEQGLRALLTQHRIESTGDVQEIEVSGNLAYCWTNLSVRVVPLAGGECDSSRRQRAVDSSQATNWFMGRSARRQPVGSKLVTPNASSRHLKASVVSLHLGVDKLCRTLFVIHS